MKILTVIGTRPEIIKLSSVISELDKYSNHIIAHTGQNFDYELNEVFFKDLSVRKPDFFLNCTNKNPSTFIGNVISKTDKLIKKIKPDAFLIYGDTNSCLSVIAAKKNKIPIFHMEAGNRCFDQRVPEEVNRKIVDHLSDINLTVSSHARDYLINEGLEPDRVIKIGSPMLEVIKKNSSKINSSKILSKYNLRKNNYFLVSIHREENVDNSRNFKALMETINAIFDKYKIPILISTHPRTRIKLQKGNYKFNKSVIFAKPFGFHDYNKLQINAKCVISDSGTITEESSIFDIPAVMIRQAHERPEGMEEGILIMSGIDKINTCKSIEIVVSQKIKKRTIKIVNDYDVENVSKKVIRIIFSYTDFVNRNIWKR